MGQNNYKVTVNSYLDINQYILPRPEEIFAALNEGQHFDLFEAYYADCIRRRIGKVPCD